MVAGRRVGSSNFGRSDDRAMMGIPAVELLLDYLNIG